MKQLDKQSDHNWKQVAKSDEWVAHKCERCGCIRQTDIRKTSSKMATTISHPDNIQIYREELAPSCEIIAMDNALR